MVAITDVVPPAPARRDDRGFFLWGAIIMAATTVAGFVVNLAAGRSSFGAPLMIHLHAVTFMAWIAIYLTQTVLAASGNVALHRRLGWFATGWVALMVAMGFAVTVFDVRAAHAPFFFKPLQFLVLDPLTVVTFAGLTYAAVALRRQTDWHRRLQFCAMALLVGPGMGRLLPMPLLAPWAYEADVAVCLLFPLAAMALDARRIGKVHPAWLWGLAVTVASFLITEAITYSPAGTAIYQVAAAGSKGAAVAPLQLGHPPGR